MEKASSPPNNCPIPWQRSFPFQQPSPFCHPACPGVPWERTRISYFAALTGATYVVLLKENHMQLFEAATLDRKSGEAEGSAVRHSGAPNLPFYNHFPFVILRVCNFIGFEKKLMLKTKGLGASKVGKSQ
jgi:hypothetical protein